MIWPFTLFTRCRRCVPQPVATETERLWLEADLDERLRQRRERRAARQDAARKGWQTRRARS